MPSTNPTLPNQAGAIDAINALVAGLLERAEKAASPEERALYGILLVVLILGFFAVALIVLYRAGWLTRHPSLPAPTHPNAPSPSAQVRASEIKAAVEVAVRESESRMKAAIDASKGEAIEAAKKLAQRKPTDPDTTMRALSVRLGIMEGMLEKALKPGNDNDSADRPAVGGTNARGRRPTGRSGSND